MAKPIKETPVLRGKDAATFTERANNVTKISSSERERMYKNYLELSSRAKF